MLMIGRLRVVADEIPPRCGPPLGYGIGDLPGALMELSRPQKNLSGHQKGKKDFTVCSKSLARVIDSSHGTRSYCR